MRLPNKLLSLTFAVFFIGSIGAVAVSSQTDNGSAGRRVGLSSDTKAIQSDTKESQTR